MGIVLYVKTSLFILLDKAGKPKRRGDQTPEKVAMPVPSSAGVVDENGQTNQTVTNVLSGEDIDSLAVNIEELQKVWEIFLSLSKGYVSIFFYAIRSFEVPIISVVECLITCLVSELLKDKKGKVIVICHLEY